MATIARPEDPYDSLASATPAPRHAPRWLWPSLGVVGFVVAEIAMATLLF